MLAASRRLPLAAVLSLAAAPLAGADVLILEAPELGAFPDPQAAVDQAPEGATLVFGQEVHPGFVIDGKSLTLVGPGTDGIDVQGTLEIVGLAADQAVRVQDLWIQGTDSSISPTLSSEPGMRILDCAGSVRVASCRIEGGAGVHDFDRQKFPTGATALFVQASQDVALLDSSIAGGAGGGSSFAQCCFGGTGGGGLVAEASNLALYDCELTGGAGGQAAGGGLGGDSCRSTESRLFASGCGFQGGDGADSSDFIASFGGDGGDGLSASGLPRPRLLDSRFEGGQAGFGVDSHGAPGTDRAWDLGSLPLIPGLHRGLRASRPLVLSGSSVELELEGALGDRFFLTAALSDNRVRQFQPPGVLLYPGPAIFPVVPQATLNRDGTTALVLPSLAIPPGLDAATWVLQALVKDANGETHISGAALVTMARATAQPDCDGSGVWDIYEALSGIGLDCDGNLELDVCQTQPDCNGNGVADGLDIACFGAQDNNGNGIPDDCEVNLELYVDAQAPSGGDGSFGSPFPSLAAAFDGALDGATIFLFDGVYAGPANRNLETGGRGLRLESLGGAGACTINLLDADSLVFGSGGGPPAPFVMHGITVERAGASAVVLQGQDGLFESCVFRDNRSPFSGGALRLTSAAFTVRDCQFLDNSSDGSAQLLREGGAIFARGRVGIERCTFDRNHADLGGALSLSTDLQSVQDPILVTHCVFRSNGADLRGGAIYSSSSLFASFGPTVWVDHGFFGFNTAGEAGGAFASDGNGLPGGVPRAVLSSCTAVENSAGIGTLPGEGGGALYLGRGVQVDVVGSILWANSAGAGAQIRVEGSPSDPAVVDVFASTVQGGAAGISLLNGSSASFSADSLSADPLFLNPPADYRLSAGSPCVDSMSSPLLQADLGDIDGDGNTFERVPLDLLLAPRSIDDPATPDTGSGPAPRPDMGAFERQP